MVRALLCVSAIVCVLIFCISACTYERYIICALIKSIMICCSAYIIRADVMILARASPTLFDRELVVRTIDNYHVHVQCVSVGLTIIDSISAGTTSDSLSIISSCETIFCTLNREKSRGWARGVLWRKLCIYYIKSHRVANCDGARYSNVGVYVVLWILERG